MQHTYITSLNWQSERKGSLAADGLPTLAVATPPEFEGHAGFWSPEHLFVAAAEVCLMSTFLAFANRASFTFQSYSSTATGLLEKTKEGLVITEITIKPRIVVTSAEAIVEAEKLIERAEKYCIVSNSMKTHVKLVSEVTVGEATT